LATTEVVDSDLTTADDRDVLEIVARYVRHQDGLDFGHGRASSDVNALVQHVKNSSLAARYGELPQASTQAGAELRRFCRERGLSLAHRPTPAGGDKAESLAAGLRLAGGRTRVPQTLVLLTDLDGVVDYEALRAAARMLIKRGNTLSLLVPDAEALARSSHDRTLGPELRTIYGRAEQRRLREATQRFVQLGVDVSVVRPHQTARAAEPARLSMVPRSA
jgi:hypothetical protein